MDVSNIQFTKIEIKITEYLFKHYKEKMNIRQMGRAMGINHAHVNVLCKTLFKKGLLSREEFGNSNFYFYNFSNPYAIKFMEYIISREIFPEWLSVAAHCLEEFKPLIQMGLIYGSSIKKKDFNDIDVLLMYEQKMRKEVEKKKEKIRKSGLLNKPVRYNEISRKDIGINQKNRIFYGILSESLLFHNPEAFSEVILECRKSEWS